MRLDDENMWEVMVGVWIEMLCFSAGLETYAERQQRVHHCLKKEKRVKIAKRRIRKKEASNKLLHRLHRVNALPQFQR
ncbi:hypothetical protein SORBI_3007G038250 [Sorghum bicolor]|uniref:Uncharacterized protein n=1 Tax=Sorghum bicolor TaxID=4558 RepID=A0A1Z5R8T3_SORBI|nr:hypothetical protein SORBI_3007G038250 [Sorghum bicolor]